MIQILKVLGTEVLLLFAGLMGMILSFNNEGVFWFISKVVMPIIGTALLFTLMVALWTVKL